MSGAAEPRAVATRLYYEDPALDFQAIVTEIELVAQECGSDGERRQLWRLALDRTAFYPESGGQPWDTGVLVATARSGARLEVPVERVEEDSHGQVWHYLHKPLVEGTAVEGRVDAARRLDHVQQHSGQHLLSAVFLARLGAVTESFHLGAEVCTIDVTLPDGLPELRAEDVAGVEAEVNRVIAENRPVRLHRVGREEAEAMLARGDLRKIPERSGPLRLVEIDGVEWNACGGTHVAATGAIGCLLVRRVEKAKRGWRVEFCCGLRAVARARGEFEALQQTARLLGTGWGELAARVEAMQAEGKLAAKAQSELLAELATMHAQEMLRGAETPAVLSHVFEDRSAEFARRVVSAVAAAGRAVVVGTTAGDEGGVALATAAGDGRRAGDVLRGVAAEFGARGGGGAEMAQAVCARERLPAFVDALALALQQP